MKHILIFLLLLVISGEVFPQGFNNAFGIRAGHSSGLEYRHYFSDEFSVKALAGTRTRHGGVQLHALAEFYEYDLFPFAYQLVFYYGFGGHAGYETRKEEQTGGESTQEVSRSFFLAGIDGVMGVEYLFYKAPLIAGLELKPYFDVYGGDGWIDAVIPWDVAFTVKFLF